MIEPPDPYEMEMEAAMADDPAALPPPPPSRFAVHVPRLSATGMDLTPGRDRRMQEREQEQEDDFSASAAAASPVDPDVFPAHRRPFPSVQSLLCTRLSMYALLLCLALMNLFVSPAQPDASCSTLQSYTTLMGCMLLASIPILAWNLQRVAKASREGREVSSMPALAWWCLALMLAAALVDSLVAIISLARNHCRADRALRQLALADVMIVMSVGCGTVLHQELRRRFPGLRFSTVNASAQMIKASVLMLCVAALVVDLTSLATHPRRGRTEYHWGLAPRPSPCVIDCPLPLQPDGQPWDNASTKRYPVCFDDRGERVEAEWCTNLPGFEDDHPLLQPCAVPLCDCNGTALHAPHCDNNFAAHRGHFWAQFNDNGDQALNAECRASWYLYGSWFTQQLNCRSMQPDPFSAGGQLVGQWDWSYRENHDQNCGGGGAGRENSAPIPLPFRFPEEVIQAGPFPEAPCAQSCERLWVSAVIYSVVLGLACLGLSLSLMCNCYRKQVETAAERVGREALAAWERTKQRMHPEQEGDAAATAAAASAAAAATSAGAADPAADHPNPDHSHLPPTTAPGSLAVSSSPDPLLVSPPADAGLGAHCLHLGRLCFQICRVLGRITVRGSSSVAPLWRQLVLLLGIGVIVGFSVLSCKLEGGHSRHRAALRRGLKLGRD